MPSPMSRTKGVVVIAIGFTLILAWIACLVMATHDEVIAVAMVLLFAGMILLAVGVIVVLPPEKRPGAFRQLDRTGIPVGGPARPTIAFEVGERLAVDEGSGKIECPLFAGPYYAVNFDVAKLPSGADTDYFLTVFWSLFSLESITELQVRAGRRVSDPDCYAVVLQSNQPLTRPETGQNKLIGDRFVRFRDNYPVSELTCVSGNFEEGHSLPLIAMVDEPGRVRFAGERIEQSYEAAKTGTVAASLQSSLDPRWKRVLDGFGQYISISRSTSKVPIDDQVYRRARLHTFFRDHAHADRVLGRMRPAIMTIRPTSEGVSSSTGQAKYHVTHEGDLKGSQVKEFLQIVVEGGGEIWEALL